MCTRLKRITSPEKRYRPLVSRAYYDVPCGQCDECRTCAQNEWFIRLWSEIQTYHRAGGKSVFLVLTYDDLHLPIFKYVDESTGEIFEIPCFNKYDKDKFINSIIQHFKRLGLTKKTTKSGLGLKFMICPEFGESPDHTHRPHLHTVLLIPEEYVKITGFTCETHWMDFFQKYWSNGFVRKSKEYGLFIDPNSDFAARYSSKYCTKDIEWFDQPQVNDFLYDDFGKKIEERYQAIKDFLPRHWQSQGFGLGLIDFCKNDNVFADGINFDFLSDRMLGKTKKYPVPRYIRRKLLYDYDKKTGRFTLNERGKSYNRDYVDVLNFNAQERISKYLSVSYIESLDVGVEFYRLYKDRFNDSVLCMNSQSLTKSFTDCLPSGVSLQDVCYYNKFIKGCVCHIEDFDKCNWIFNTVDPRKGWLKEICHYLQDISFLDHTEKDEEFSEGFMREKKFSPEMLFFLDDLPVFRKFDLFLQRIEFLRNYVSARRNCLYREDVKRRKLVKLICS